MTKVYNFNAGPAILPRPVLEHAQQELLDYQGHGISVMEMSHRSKEFEAINAEAEARFKRLLNLDESYRVLFLQGGASLQFAMVPLNFLPPDGVVDLLMTGSWSEKAKEEAAKIGKVHEAASTREENYCRIPRPEEIRLSDSPAYVHITSNETIHGVQWQYWPEVGERPLIADMSSDILSRPLDATRFDLIYAGAQKNLGPSGVTAVLIRQSWLETAAKTPPTILRYATHAKNNSLYNTPPTFGIYLLNLVLGWIEDNGGLEAMGQRNALKAGAIYAAIDGSGGFYRGHAAPDSRSLMNVTFRLPSEALEKQFIAEATAANMIGLGGHRSVGGIRASIYNAMDQEGCDVLAGFMQDFAHRNG
ncbi:MAG TPA: 3-phosphoserine/phosphohydroxythreonine transaminase [Herpetosiphonaceae bacterium]